MCKIFIFVRSQVAKIAFLANVERIICISFIKPLNLYCWSISKCPSNTLDTVLFYHL